MKRIINRKRGEEICRKKRPSLRWSIRKEEPVMKSYTLCKVGDRNPYE